MEFLSLDHINGGGYQQRKTIKISWWNWLRRNNYPEGFRVLCHNCNQALGMYGYCPHHGGESKLAVAFASYDEHAPSKSNKLTYEIAQEIRRRIQAGATQCQLALEYKVSRATICLIHKNKHWKG